VRQPKRGEGANKKWGAGGAAPPEDEVGVGRRDDGPVLALGRQVLQRIEEHLMAMVRCQVMAEAERVMMMVVGALMMVPRFCT